MAEGATPAPPETKLYKIITGLAERPKLTYGILIAVGTFMLLCECVNFAALSDNDTETKKAANGLSAILFLISIALIVFGALNITCILGKVKEGTFGKVCSKLGYNIDSTA